MPFKNEHALRIEQPEKYDSFARKELTDGISAVLGIKDGKSEIQSIRFDKDKFTPEQAKKWAKDHEYNVSGFESAVEKESNNQDYMRAFLEAIKNIIDRDVYKKIFNFARAHAGGKAKKKNTEQCSLSLAKAALEWYQEYEEESFVAEIKKQNEEKQIVYAVVLEPMTNVTPEGDLHGHRMTEEEIEKTAHTFLEKHQTIGLQHSKKIEARPVESFIAPEDLYNGEIKKGSWVLGVHVIDKDIWKKIKNGDINAFSPGGFGSLKAYQHTA